MEYMALGIPVVVNDNPDQKAVVESAQCGLCVEGSAVAFAHAMLALLADPARCAAMGIAGQRYVNENRGYNKLAADLANAYRDFFHKRQGR
jgi:glycosyltransferase involved in cell wall biosynthesis